MIDEGGTPGSSARTCATSSLAIPAAAVAAVTGERAGTSAGSRGRAGVSITVGTVAGGTDRTW
jgi:hypothetical protein